MEKVERLLDNSDFPIYSEFAEYLRIIEDLHPDHWTALEPDEDETCSFCRDPHLVYLNLILNHEGLLEPSTNRLKSCEQCFNCLQDGEFDLINPEDDPLSLGLRTIVCRWIQLTYCDLCESSVYFDEYGFEKNDCDRCHQPIVDDDKYIALVDIGDKFLAAHEDCFKDDGWGDLLTTKDYNYVIELHVKDRFDKFRS